MKSKGLFISMAGAAFLVSFGVANAQSVPTITSFVATPSSITNGQNSVLSWVVTDASSTSIDNGIGTVAGASVIVSPVVTTTYDLSAVNPMGTTSASVTVTVDTSTSGSNLQLQIQNIQNQIATLTQQLQLLLQQQQQANVGGSASSCAVFNRDLSEGDDGSDVRALQQTLSSSVPSIFPPGLVTGYFGEHTKEALKIFQEKMGIASTSTGFFGPLTRDFLGRECESENGVVSSSTTISNGGQEGNGPMLNLGDGNRGEGRGNGIGNDQ